MDDARSMIHRQRGEDEIGTGAGDDHVGCDMRGEDFGRADHRRHDLAPIASEDGAVHVAAPGGVDGEHRFGADEGAGLLGVDSEGADADRWFSNDQRETPGGGDADAKAGE